MSERRPVRTAVASAALAMLAACASMAPRYERPAAPVAAAFPDSGAGTPSGTPPATDIAWQDFFADPRLKRLIDTALTNNRDLRVAVLNIEQARAAYGVRRADRLPTVNAGANVQRQNIGMEALYTVGLQVTGYEVDLFGRVRSLSDAALAQYFGTEEARKSVQMSLIASVANAYYAVLADDALLNVTQQTLRTREESFKLTRLMFEHGAARAAFFPRISLTASAGTASTELSGLFKGGSGAWTFAPSIVLPLFDAGRNQANLDAAQAGRDIAVAQYERAVQTAFREVADALAGRATLDEQARAQATVTRAEEIRLQLADLRYRNGASSYLDVLDAQRALFAAQQAVVQVQAARVQNLVTLYKALGGGWSEPATK